MDVGCTQGRVKLDLYGVPDRLSTHVCCTRLDLGQTEPEVRGALCPTSGAHAYDAWSVHAQRGFVADFQWCVGDVCEVDLAVSNPMPFELKVSNVVSGAKPLHQGQR